MFDGQHGSGNTGARICILFILIWICGCSAMGTGRPPQQWSCDPAADAAVHQADWQRALRLHQALLERDAANCLAIYHLGYIHGKLGDRNSEVAQYQRAVRCGYDKDDQLYFNLGMAYGEMSAMADAFSAFEQAVAIDPANPENHFGLGLMAQAAGQTERAWPALLRAVELDSNHWDARILLVRIFLDQGRLETARGQLDVLINAIPENEEVVELRQIYEDRRISSYDH